MARIDSVTSRGVMDISGSVIAMGFRGLETYPSLLALNCEGHISFVDDRLGLAARVAALRPKAVFFPSHDADGVSTAPIIRRLQREAPEVRAIVLVREGETAKGLAETIRAGAHLRYWSTSKDIRRVIASSLEDSAIQPESIAVEELVRGLHPESCARMLVFAIENAHRHLSVDQLAKAFSVSRRSLNRLLLFAKWPPAAELLDWARLSRVSLLHWKDPSSAVVLAHASGFADPRALRRAVKRLLGSITLDASVLTPSNVRMMLGKRLEVLARRA